MAQEEPALVRRRAFVVQFRAETEFAQARCLGRVEHVTSGQAANFQSLEELLAFFMRILTAERTQLANTHDPSGSEEKRSGCPQLK